MHTRTSGHVSEYYGPNFPCTESTSYPEKKERLELNLWISVKNKWVLFFGGHHVYGARVFEDLERYVFSSRF